MVRHGVRVPDDVAIGGYDDIDVVVTAAVPLSSVRKPRYELFEPQLVVRESSTVRRRGIADGKGAP
jgi:LacI family transcriptional regulator